jgi:hypothetical protein
MSRGPGKLQRLLFQIIRDNSSEPKTFAELRGGDVDPVFERSCRRALKNMVDGNIILVLGKGGPGDPHRYCVNPIFAAMADVIETTTP